MTQGKELVAIQQQNITFAYMERGGYVYIISNKNRTTLYTGVTSDIEARTFDHKAGKGSIFAAKYNCTDLIYYEEFIDIEEAIYREKQLKKWRREWKMELIKKSNPDLLDLAKGWYDE